MDTARITERLDEEWTRSVEPSLEDYVRIPNKSPL